jgi:pimeloyl-ACP methyl ester carboxylesterase
MARHIEGALYHERMGRKGPPMAFVHPNPMDQSCWLFQMAHLSTWFRCIAIDVPGYGRSPKASEGLTLGDMAEACWEALDSEMAGEKAVLVGCSVGSSIVQQMYHVRPAQTAAIVVSGTGYNKPGTVAPFAAGRIQDYEAEGLAFRWRYTFQDLSPAFRATPLAHFFADMFMERNATADVASIVHQFRALGAPRPEHFFSGIRCPTLILTGTEDVAHAGALELKDHIPDAELRVLPGAGHACHMEQPWLFDRLLVEFLKPRGLFPAPA